VRWQPAIAGLSLGLVYAVLYFFLAFAASGAGHGTGLFLVAVLPYGFGLIAFPVLGFFAGDLRPFISKLFFIFVLVTHYALVINFLRVDDLRDPVYVKKMWDLSPWYILLPAAFYIGGQLLLWSLFVRSLIVGNSGATEQIVGRERRERVL
jgi:uncharacterized membrane protein (GlpM family)